MIDADGWFKSISSGLIQIGFPAKQDQINKLIGYLNILEKWNQAYNLTRIPIDQRIDKIVLESATAGAIIRNYSSGNLWGDLGAGAGIPGMVLAILNPDRSIHLIDSRMKAIDFLYHVTTELKLANIQLIRERVENMDRSVEDKFDVLYARAVAPVMKVLALSQPVLKPGGYLVIPGGRLKPGKKVLLDLKKIMWHVVIDKIDIPMRQEKESCLVLLKEGESK